MAECNGDGNGLPASLHADLDFNYLILSQFSDVHKAQILKETAGAFTVERGARYNGYSLLRDKKLRTKQLIIQLTPEKQIDHTLQNRRVLTPQKKQMKFNSQATPTKRTKGSSGLTQSVPDLSYVLRKENRKPALGLSPVLERSSTPPTGMLKRSTPPTNSGEKRGSGLIGRSSYASVDELKGSAVAASNTITNGENRGERISRGNRRSVSGYRML